MFIESQLFVVSFLAEASYSTFFSPNSTSIRTLPLPRNICQSCSLGKLGRLPLHLGLDRLHGTFLGYVTVLYCSVVVSASALTPDNIYSRSFALLESLDCIAFLLVCCIEIAFPSLSLLIWGEVMRMPPKCCEHVATFVMPRMMISFGVGACRDNVPALCQVYSADYA